MTRFSITIATAFVAACTSAQAQNASGAVSPENTPTAESTPAQKSRLPIKARTHEEYVAYQEAIAKKQDGDAMAKAAADFAAKFPDSSIRVLLYRASMKSYRQSGDAQKMMDAALKVLQLSKDDPEALLAVAQVQEEHTSQMDLDRDERMDQAVANAQRALATIDTDLVVPVNTRPDSIEPYKKFLRASALAIVGTIQYRREQYPEAEATLRQAVDLDPGNADGVIVLRLALALDQQKKYQEALQQANRAVELTKEDTEAGRLARNERGRLTALLAQNSAPGASDVVPASNDSPPGQ
jgi:tetratricopeptide (TPR) repeat protein